MLSKFQCGGTKKKDVYHKFVKKAAKCHKKCYPQYDQNHFHRFPLPAMEKSSGSKEFGPKSLKRSKRVSLHLGQMVCFICNKPATNLCAARVMHASKTAADKQHVKETSEKINTTVIGLDNKPILAKLSSGDILSNELNYHKSCLKTLQKSITRSHSPNPTEKYPCGMKLTSFGKQFASTRR